MGRRTSKMLQMVVVGALMLCTAQVVLAQRLDESCTVSVLNRTVREWCVCGGASLCLDGRSCLDIHFCVRYRFVFCISFSNCL